MEKIIVGKILKPQGIKGELKLKPMLDDFNKLSTFSFVFIGEKEIQYKVIKCNIRMGFAYLTLEGVNDRNTAENFKNKFVKVMRKQIGDLGKNKYLIADLIGLNIIDKNTQELLGLLVDVEQYGAADILIIEQNKKEYMIPFISDIFFDIDLEKKIILVDKKLFNEVKICD